MIVPVVNPRDSIVLERDELQKKYSVSYLYMIVTENQINGYQILIQFKK
jgi:hypothetical protein